MCTKNILKSAVIASSIGVRQGAPTSCLLFVLYMDKLVKMLKERVALDGYLGSLHALLMMDDTVILATSRSMCIKKLEILMEYCLEYGMVVNEKKTKFFVINGDEIDKNPLHIQNLIVFYCSKYLYLGSWFEDTGKMKAVLALHEKACTPCVNKYAVFCAVNATMPFLYKIRVLQAAITSSLLYSSESWLSTNLKPIERS